MDSKFLTYNNVVLRRSDLQSLEGRNYLNDTIIDFYFEYLSTRYQSSEILLVSTSISFLLANTLGWDVFTATVESLNFDEKKLIIFTINNSSFSSSGGGSHWSLLVYCRKRNLFMHYDSLNMMNHAYAYSLYESVNGFISYDSAEFMESRAPRQSNGYDCGLYLIEIAKVICECYFNVEQFQTKEEICRSFNVMRRVNSKHVEFNMRSKLLQLISKLKRKETNASR